MIELATFSGPDDWQLFPCRLATLAAPYDWQLFQCRLATLAAPYDWQLFQCHMIGNSCIAIIKAKQLVKRHHLRVWVGSQLLYLIQLPSFPQKMECDSESKCY
jgi:hypothetical protein